MSSLARMSRIVCEVWLLRQIIRDQASFVNITHILHLTRSTAKKSTSLIITFVCFESWFF